MKRTTRRTAKRRAATPLRNGHKMQRTHGSSKYEHHCSPPSIVTLLHRFGFVAVDPCSNRWSMIRAVLSLCGKRKADDGLRADWAKLAIQLDSTGRMRRGFVFVNPPYGRKLIRWAIKVALEAARGVEIITLTAARHDTAWWRTLFGSATAVAYVRGRVRHYKRGKQQDAAFFPSAMLYFGSNTDAFCETFDSIADCFVIERGRLAITTTRSVLRAHPPSPLEDATQGGA